MQKDFLHALSSLYPEHFLKHRRKRFRSLYNYHLHPFHLRQKRISMPIAISSMQSTNTRKPDGNNAPKSIPRAIAIAHTIKKLPLLRHMFSPTFLPFWYILRKKKNSGELSSKNIIFFLFPRTLFSYRQQRSSPARVRLNLLPLCAKALSDSPSFRF